MNWLVFFSLLLEEGRKDGWLSASMDGSKRIRSDWCRFFLLSLTYMRPMYFYLPLMKVYPGVCWCVLDFMFLGLYIFFSLPL